MRPEKQDVRATYDRIAESYAATRTSPWPEVVPFIDSLPSHSRVLDAGSGPGRHARLLVQGGHVVVALDFSRRLLAIGRNHPLQVPALDEIAWIEGDATRLPFRDRSFGAAICIAVLHHLPTEEGRIAALVELRRILRRGGSLLVSAWSRNAPRFRSLPAAGPGGTGDVTVPWTMPRGSQVPRFYHLFAEGELERLIIESGLHGETFFQSAENWFARAKSDG